MEFDSHQGMQRMGISGDKAAKNCCDEGAAPCSTCPPLARDSHHSHLSTSAPAKPDTSHDLLMQACNKKQFYADVFAGACQHKSYYMDKYEKFPDEMKQRVIQLFEKAAGNGHTSISWAQFWSFFKDEDSLPNLHSMLCCSGTHTSREIEAMWDALVPNGTNDNDKTTATIGFPDFLVVYLWHHLSWTCCDVCDKLILDTTYYGCKTCTLRRKQDMETRKGVQPHPTMDVCLDCHQQRLPGQACVRETQQDPHDMVLVATRVVLNHVDESALYRNCHLESVECCCCQQKHDRIEEALYLAYTNTGTPHVQWDENVRGWVCEFCAFAACKNCCAPLSKRPPASALWLNWNANRHRRFCRRRYPAFHVMNLLSNAVSSAHRDRPRDIPQCTGCQARLLSGTMPGATEEYLEIMMEMEANEYNTALGLFDNFFLYDMFGGDVEDTDEGDNGSG